jgi:hypothetical protein
VLDCERVVIGERIDVEIEREAVAELAARAA